MAKIDESAVMLRGSVVAGDVTLGKDVGIWYNAVLRADHCPIVVNEGSNVQDNTVIHVGLESPTVIGKGVTIGHAAIIHGCTIGDNTLVGMGAIIMDDAVVGKDCVIGAGALITQGKVIPDGSVVFGAPAKVVRPATPDEIAYNEMTWRTYVDDIKKAALEEGAIS